MGRVFKQENELKKEAANKRYKGKYTISWTDGDGVRRKKTIGTDKAAATRVLFEFEEEASKIKAGLITRSRLDQDKAAKVPLAQHVEDYRSAILSKGHTEKHADHIRTTLTQLFENANIKKLSDLATDRVASALGRIRKDRSARTANHARGAIKAFARWMVVNGRIESIPLPILALDPYNQKADRKRIRRAITKPELDRLLKVTEEGPPVEASRGPRKQTKAEKGEPAMITGPERAALYRLTMGTGFRAKELRTLTPERFQLDGNEPSITVLACYSKNGKEAIQPITRELAAGFRPFLKGKAPGHPVLNIPAKTAKLLQGDLSRAGIPYKDDEGRVLDFHALRASYITHLILAGVNIKIVQTLARHSSITLTLDTYTHIDAAEIRRALEGT